VLQLYALSQLENGITSVKILLSSTLRGVLLADIIAARGGRAKIVLYAGSRGDDPVTEISMVLDIINVKMRRANIAAIALRNLPFAQSNKTNMSGMTTRMPLWRIPITRIHPRTISIKEE